jgi:hypothetical protein
MMSFLFAESPSSGQAETRPIDRTIYSRAEFRSLHLTEEIFSAFLDHLRPSAIMPRKLSQLLRATSTEQ